MAKLFKEHYKDWEPTVPGLFLFNDERQPLFEPVSALIQITGGGHVKSWISVDIKMNAANPGQRSPPSKI